MPKIQWYISIMETVKFTINKIDIAGQLKQKRDEIAYVNGHHLHNISIYYAEQDLDFFYFMKVQTVQQRADRC